MNTANEVGAYLGLALLAIAVLTVGLIAADMAGGMLGIPAGAAAALVSFQALRRVTGRAVGAAVDSA